MSLPFPHAVLTIIWGCSPDPKETSLSTPTLFFPGLYYTQLAPNWWKHPCLVGTLFTLIFNSPHFAARFRLLLMWAVPLDLSTYRQSTEPGSIVCVFSPRLFRNHLRKGHATAWALYHGGLVYFSPSADSRSLAGNRWALATTISISLFPSQFEPFSVPKHS